MHFSFKVNFCLKKCYMELSRRFVKLVYNFASIKVIIKFFLDNSAVILIVCLNPINMLFASASRRSMF